MRGKWNGIQPIVERVHTCHPAGSRGFRGRPTLAVAIAPHPMYPNKHPLKLAQQHHYPGYAPRDVGTLR
jgi:hypothetical protein